MNTYRYKVIADSALEFYRENGMEFGFDPSVLNGVLIVEAPDEDTAESIRKTFTDIRMWEKIND